MSVLSYYNRGDIMNFADKLVFLLSVTHTSNIKLAKAINVDPSMISRLRKGRRNIPRNINHIKAMAKYFAKRCNGEYQRFTLAEILGMERIRTFTEEQLIEDVLLEWLSGTMNDGINNAGLFLRAIDCCMIPNNKGESDIDKNDVFNLDSKRIKQVEDGINTFFGNEGKRQALELFLSRILEQKKSCIIKITTDENTEWLLENSEYTKYLSKILNKLINMKCYFKIIIPAVTNLNGILELMNLWLPYILSGNIDMYYYPRLKDGLFRRTLFIASDCAVLSSTSISCCKEQSLTLLGFDKKVISGFENEFDGYIMLCRKIGRTYDFEQYRSIFFRHALERTGNFPNCISRSRSLSFTTIPNDILNRLMDSCGITSNRTFLEIMMRDNCHLYNVIEEQLFIDIMPLVAFNDILKGVVPIAGSEIIFGKQYYYSAYDYKKHLVNLLELLERNVNYYVILDDEYDICQNIIHIKEGAYVILLRKKEPISIIEISENNMVAAFWECVYRKVIKKYKLDVKRRESIFEITKLIQQLEHYGV